MGYGVASIRKAAMEELERDPEAFRAKVRPWLLVPAIEAIHHALCGTGPFTGKPPQRWAVRLGLQVAGWLDMRSEVAVVLRLAQDYGLRDESEIRARLELAGKVQSVGLESAQARATDLLRRIMAADPGRRDAIRAELFGEAKSLPANEVSE